MSYAEFLKTKQRVWAGSGIEATGLSSQLFDWQAAIVRWALRKGRAAIFADCGLGKTPMQLAWASAVKKKTLILAPLCVAEQTVREGQKFGIDVKYAADMRAAKGSIIVTNYERLEKFDVSAFGAAVLDESSILKAFDGKTRTALIQTFSRTPFRLCCTATPAPNDIAELANHAEFLGLMTRAEFLATWFVHDDMGWRLKRHAVKPFYRWMASWALTIRKPSDLGFDDEGFHLPPLEIVDHVVDSDAKGTLFPELGLKGISGRLGARRDSLTPRCQEAAALISKSTHQAIAWCGLNDESETVSRMVSASVNVSGNDTMAEKTSAVLGFVAGDIRVLVSKVRILGFGLNFQNCAHMVFVGLGDSYEQYYQAIRRCWRFGQKKTVRADIVVSDAERFIAYNVRRKEQQANEMHEELLTHLRDFEREELVA